MRRVGLRAMWRSAETSAQLLAKELEASQADLATLRRELAEMTTRYAKACEVGRQDADRAEAAERALGEIRDHLRQHPPFDVDHPDDYLECLRWAEAWADAAFRAAAPVEKGTP